MKQIIQKCIYVIGICACCAIVVGCKANKAKIPLKSPCACYDVIIDMSEG